MAKLSRHAYGTYIIRSIDLTDDDNMVKISHLDTSDSVVKNYETINPVMKNYETINFPVVKSTAKTSDSVVKSTTKTSDPVVKPTTETSAPTIKSEIDTQAIFESLVMMEQCLANIRSTLKIPRSYRYHPNWRNDPDNCPPVGSDQWKEFRQRDLTNAVEFVTAYHARVDQ